MLTWISLKNNMVSTHLFLKKPVPFLAFLIKVSELGLDFGLAQTSSQQRGDKFEAICINKIERKKIEGICIK